MKEFTQTSVATLRTAQPAILKQPVQVLCAAFKRSLPAVLLGLALCAASDASAQTIYYWDSNDGAAGFGTTAGTWATPTPGTVTTGWSTDSTGSTTVNGNSVTTTVNDAVFFGTATTTYTGATTINGTVNVGTIFQCSGHPNLVAGASPVINFGAAGSFESLKTAAAFPTLTITGAGTSMTWISSRNMNIGAVTNNTSSTGKTILQTSTASTLSYPCRVAMTLAINLGPIGVGLQFNGATLRMNTGFPYTSLSALNTDHPVAFTLNKNSGLDNEIQNSTFTVDLPINLGTGKFYAEGINSTSVIKLTQANTMGGTYLTSGALEISDSSQLGAITSPFTFGSGNSAELVSGILRITGTSMTNLGARPVFTTPTKDVGFDIADAANKFTVDKGLDQTSGNFTKNGLGTLILTGANTYTGTTTVSAGTLLVNGNSAAVTNVVNVPTNCAFGGTGTIGAVVRYQNGSRAQFTVGSLMAFTNAAFMTNVTVRVDLGSNLGNGTYVLATNYVSWTTNGSLTFATNSGSLGSGSTGAVSVNGKNLLLTVSGVTGTPSPALLTNSVSGSLLTLSWPAGQGWRLQAQTNALSVGISTNWTTVTDASVSSTNLTLNPANPATFYRLIYQP